MKKPSPHVLYAIAAEQKCSFKLLCALLRGKTATPKGRFSPVRERAIKALQAAGYLPAEGGANV